MRSYDYISNMGMEYEIFLIVKEYCSNLLEVNLNDFSQDGRIKIESMLSSCKKFLNRFDKSYPNNIGTLIRNDLLSPEVINKLSGIDAKYPHESSKIGCEFESSVIDLFKMEDDVSLYVADVWNKKMTSFSDFVNGEDFMLVGTAINDPRSLPGGRYYKSGEWYHSYISASLFSNNTISPFMGNKLVVVCGVDRDSFIGASEVDIATSESKTSSIKSLKKLDDGKYIFAGYTSGKPCTKLLTPELLEKRRVEDDIKHNGNILENGFVNEILLDKSKTKLQGILLVSNGCDNLISEYITAKASFQEMGLPFKCLNKGLYKEKIGLSVYTNEDLNNLNHSLDNTINYLYQNYDDTVVKNILTGYCREVVEPMKYSEEVKMTIYNKINDSLGMDTKTSGISK